MRAAWATDVHLEFLDSTEFNRFTEAVRSVRPEALFLTGDIANARSLGGLLSRVREAVGVPVLFVLGNHDFYYGSIAEVRSMAAAFHTRDEGLRWLPEAGPWRASDGTVVLGVDGWADGRCGSPERSTVLLNDWRMIRDFEKVGAMYDLAARRALLEELADADASRLESALRGVLPEASRVAVLTHIPPFEGACWHEGALSNDEWRPWFTCVAVGEALRRVADEFPSTQFSAYCGHTHSSGEFRARENLVVHTGEARYGETFVRAVAP